MKPSVSAWIEACGEDLCAAESLLQSGLATGAAQRQMQVATGRRQVAHIGRRGMVFMPRIIH